MNLAHKDESERSIVIPSSIFQDRDLSVLEAIVEYFKEKKGMKYSEIARLLNRDDRTIWTSYKRSKEKRNEIENKNKKINQTKEKIKEKMKKK